MPISEGSIPSAPLRTIEVTLAFASQSIPGFPQQAVELIAGMAIFGLALFR
jgi:hypothetical protein